MDRASALETLELAASDQWGIVTAAQAEREGVSRLQLGRLAQRGVVQRARRGVYLLPSVRYERLTDLKVAWLALDPSRFARERWRAELPIVVSHESAADVHGIGDMIPQWHMFSCPVRKQTSHSDVRISLNRELASEDIRSVDGLPVMSVERTVADLAARRIDRDYLATLVVDSLRKEGVRFSTLSAYLDPFAQSYGSGSGEDLLHEVYDESASEEDRKELRDRLSPRMLAALGVN